MIIPKLNINGAIYSASLNLTDDTVCLINSKTRSILRVKIDGLKNTRLVDLVDNILYYPWEMLDCD